MIQAEKSCLVLIDVQEKLIRVMQNPQGVIRNCEILIQVAQTLDIPIVWCQQNPRALGPVVSPLAALLEKTDAINKMSFSCCRAEAFNEKLHNTGADTIILCGIETHVCVFQTAMDLFKKGLRVHVVADAVGSRTEDNKQIALGRLAQTGVVLTSTEMFLFELLGSADHPHFKALASLIK